jgi:RNA polymerase sigma-70 factor (ECF subfamily)
MPQCELSEDLTQEVLLAAWRTLSQFRGDSSLKSWVLGIARHKIEDYYRNRIREMELPEDGEETSDELITPARLDEQLEAAEQTEKVQRTLSKIPEAYCLALLWRYREGKSLRDMAEATGKTEKAMERMLARARETFRRRWNDGQS